ncbi:SOLUTE CARRIER FAMILY 25 [Salix purpurea]|uniref:SOLUTE CARRIER FAMILY 25 n=1 Tax=Salix purpurea TaxID=77065 RepID=A0A9Q0T9H3_SALPP|nr:SOLUTE CARRIER FAMILY 25 [Salix purpurea]
MASEEVKTSESAASTIVNRSEEAKLVHEGVKTPGPALLSICKSLFSGGVAGGVSRTSVAPLERLKILLQVQNPHSIQYNGTIQGLKYIWRTEGLRGLFKGNGTYCARIVPNSAVKFFSYEEASERQTGKDDAQLTPLLRLGAGACAGIIAMSATYPMDMVRGRLTVQTSLLASTEESLMLYQQSSLRKVLGLYTKTGCHLLACGAAAGTVGQTVAYPLDVIRRRMQMVGWKDTASVVTGDRKGKAAIQYTGMVDAFRKTVRHKGFGALYKGLVPNSVKVIPSIAIAFVTYEMVKVVLGVEMRISD